MRGIYVTSREGDRVSGHYLSMQRGRWVVHAFCRCTLSKVIEVAEHVIADPQVYQLEGSK